MGKATQAKQLKMQEQESKLMSSFAQHNLKILAKKSVVEPPVHFKLQPYQSLFLKNASDYQVKTKSKDKSKQLLEVVRFTFNKYAVCQALTNVWSYEKPPGILVNRSVDEKGNINVTPIDFKLWYICVAKGGSLYKEYAKENLSKKEVHCLTTCPHNLSLAEAIVYSIAKAEVKNEGIALRIARTKLNDRVLTDFWKSVIRFFAKHTPNSIAEINDLIDFIESRLRLDNKFSMAGHTLEVLKKRMTDWHYELRRVKVLSGFNWTGASIPNDTFTSHNQKGDEIVWSIDQIVTGKDLAHEGSSMHHCVYGYKDQCIRGKCSIWSLKLTEYHVTKPKITVEVNHGSYGYSIVQARGYANRGLKNDEKHILSLWAKKNDISFSNYY